MPISLIQRGSGCVDRISLKPLNALLGAAPRVDTIGAVSISENPSIALASLATRRGRADRVAEVAEELGLDLPGPGRASGSAPYAALWLGPDQWLIMAEGDADQDIAGALETAFGTAASVTEQTGGWVCLDVTGPALPALFERLCAVDSAAMEPGQGTRTVIEHLGCYIICIDAAQFRLFGPRSSAGSLHHALTTAAQAIA